MNQVLTEHRMLLHRLEGGLDYKDKIVLAMIVVGIGMGLYLHYNGISINAIVWQHLIPQAGWGRDF